MEFNLFITPVNSICILQNSSIDRFTKIDKMGIVVWNSIAVVAAGVARGVYNRFSLSSIGDYRGSIN